MFNIAIGADSGDLQRTARSALLQMLNTVVKRIAQQATFVRPFSPLHPPAVRALLFACQLCTVYLGITADSAHWQLRSVLRHIWAVHILAHMLYPVQAGFSSDTCMSHEMGWQACLGAWLWVSNAHVCAAEPGGIPVQ